MPSPHGGASATPRQVQAAIDRAAAARPSTEPVLAVEDLPGPTGESNRLSLHPRGVVLCLGPDAAAALAQARQASARGCTVVAVAPGIDAAAVPGESVDGMLDAEALATLHGFDVVASQADEGTLRRLRRALAGRNGPLLPLVSGAGADPFVLERHLCVDTTAAGGNASLLAAAG